MRLLIILFGMMILFAGCAQEQPSQGQEPSSPSQQPAANADAVLKDCIENICGIGNDTMTKTCTVSCWEDYALAKADPSYCDKNIEILNSTVGYNVCVEAIAKSMNDASPCGLIKKEFDRDLCYVELAQWLDDPSVCDNVGDENVMLVKQDCLNALEES